jgi:hypothetical protein
MATTISTQKLIDSNKRALIKVVCLFDGTAQTRIRIVDAANLNFALNTAGYIKTNHANAKPVYKTTIKRIFGQGNFANGYATLIWGGNANSVIATVGDGQFDYNFDSEGLSAAIGIPDTANATGDIQFSTTGLLGNDSLTLFLDLKKDASDFDQGQTADPAAFNQGRWKITP